MTFFARICIRGGAVPSENERVRSIHPQERCNQIPSVYGGEPEIETWAYDMQETYPGLQIVAFWSEQR